MLIPAPAYSDFYQILLEKYNLLRDENKKLKEEIKHLHSLIMPSAGQTPEISESPKDNGINKHSSPEDKIALQNCDLEAEQKNKILPADLLTL